MVEPLAKLSITAGGIKENLLQELRILMSETVAVYKLSCADTVEGKGGLTRASPCATSTGRRWSPCAILQAQTLASAFHDVACEARIHHHITQLERSPTDHSISHVERRATGHPCVGSRWIGPAS